MENILLLNITLSKVFNRNKRFEKVLRILSKPVKHGKTFSGPYGWIEIKLLSKSKFGLGVYLSYEEFNWLLNCVKNKLSDVIWQNGKRTLMFKQLGSNNFILASVEDKKIFGLELTEDELEKIYNLQSWVTFIIKYMVPNNVNLSFLKVYLLVMMLANNLKSKFVTLCPGCNREGTDHTTCKMKFNEMADKYVLLDMALMECETEFMEKYDFLENVLEYKEENLKYDVFRTENYKNDLMLQLVNHLDNNIGMSYELQNVLKDKPFF